MTRINKIIDGNVAGILLCYVFRCWQLSFFGIPQNQFGRETQLDDTSVLVAQLKAELSWNKLSISCCWSFAHKGILKCVQYLPVAPPDPLFNPISLLALFSAPGRNWLQESLWFPWVWSLGHAFRMSKGRESELLVLFPTSVPASCSQLATVPLTWPSLHMHLLLEFHNCLFLHTFESSMVTIPEEAHPYLWK